jgi:mono/diheme cytochrome c family protein
MRIVRFAFVILLLIGAGVVAALLYVRLRGVSARNEPGRAEAFIATRLRRIAIPRSARDMTNPVTQSREVLSQAMEHFADHCSFCHANDGSGNTPIGKGLFPKPPDMRRANTQNLTDGEIYYIMQNGVRFTGMPGFGDADNPRDEDTWKLVHFIRHLPNISEEELARMKDLNPKTPADLQEEEEIRKFLEGNSPDEPSGNRHKHH